MTGWGVPFAVLDGKSCDPSNFNNQGGLGIHVHRVPVCIIGAITEAFNYSRESTGFDECLSVCSEILVQYFTSDCIGRIIGTR